MALAYAGSQLACHEFYAKFLAKLKHLCYADITERVMVLMIYNRIGNQVQINADMYTVKIGYGGYLVIESPYNKGKRIHRLVIEAVLGRELSIQEHVHHIDSNKLNNTPDNLEIVGNSEHIKLHNPKLTDQPEKKIIQEIILQEDKKHPIGDCILTRMLNNKGYSIIRRTVAKYRSQLGYPPASKRK